MWIIMAWQGILPKVTVKGSRQWMGLIMLCCRMTVKKMGMFGVSLRALAHTPAFCWIWIQLRL